MTGVGVMQICDDGERRGERGREGEIEMCVVRSGHDDDVKLYLSYCLFAHC